MLHTGTTKLPIHKSREAMLQTFPAARGLSQRELSKHAHSNGKLRPRPHVPGYFRIRNFLFPDTATVHTHPANSTANPEKKKSALQSGKK